MYDKNITHDVLPGVAQEEADTSLCPIIGDTELIHLDKVVSTRFPR